MRLHHQQIAFWTFDGAPIFKEGEPIHPKVSSTTPLPYLTMHHQDIDDNGTDGRPYMDANNVVYRASRAISWDDIKGSGPDAELHIAISTRGWENLLLRFDYRAETADSFDLDYRTDDENDWHKLIDRHRIEPDYRWHDTTLDLSEYAELNDCEQLYLRLYDFDRNGNDHLVLDNIELTGTRMQGQAYPPRVVGLPEAISAVIGSKYQPPFNHERGFLFHVSQPDTTSDGLSVTVESQNTDIIEDVQINAVRNKYGIYRLELGEPAGEVGLTKLIVRAQAKNATQTTIAIPYGASAGTPEDSTFFYTGTSDVSAVVEIDENWMIVGVDEDNILRVYPRKHPAGPVSEFPLIDGPDEPPFYLTDVKRDGLLREMDIEAAERLEDRIFWIGSHSNNDSGDLRPNRNRIFATDMRVLEGHVTMSIVGAYANLRHDLTKWGDEHGYNFADFMAEGTSAKAEKGMNIEGFTINHQTHQGLLGFRAPIIDGKALLAPVENFVQWFNNGSPVRPPELSAPIELDLGNRGIRAMRQSEHGYVIVAGPCDEDGDFALFTWSGNLDEKPQQHGANLEGTRPEAIIVMTDGPFTEDTRIQLLSDNGDTDWYDLGEDSENFIAPLQKFRSDFVTLGKPTETT